MKRESTFPTQKIKRTQIEFIYIYMGIPPDGPYWSILGGRPRRADLHLGPDNCGIVQGKRDRYYCGIVRGKKEPDCKF